MTTAVEECFGKHGSLMWTTICPIWNTIPVTCPPSDFVWFPSSWAEMCANQNRPILRVEPPGLLTTQKMKINVYRMIWNIACQENKSCAHHPVTATLWQAALTSSVSALVSNHPIFPSCSTSSFSSRTSGTSLPPPLLFDALGHGGADMPLTTSVSI
jgi:hypothetical protein